MTDRHRAAAHRIGTPRKIALTILAACLMAAGGAQTAQATITAYAEPTYTKTNANNVFWWSWTAHDGGSSQTGDDYRYFHCLRTLQNGVLVESSNGPSGGPGSQNCTGLIRSQTNPNPRSGNAAYLPFAANTVLANGSRYQMCTDAYANLFGVWVHDPANFGNCAATTIDRDKPVIQAAVNGTQEITNNPNLSLTIAYDDATSPPWQGANGLASNWICITHNTECAPPTSYDQNCSIPQNRNARIQTFSCGANVTNAPDGKWYFCAVAADTAVPDNPNGTNQFASATSNNANLSGRSCGFVTVDRAAPAVTAQASATSVTTGTLVSFSGAATDPNGVNGQYEWDFGDNTPKGAGPTTTHTYTQPGTYQARVATKDAAGNSGTGTVTITVNPPASGGGTTPPPTNGGGGSTPPPNNGGGGGSTPPPNMGGGTPPPNTGGTPDPGTGTPVPGTQTGTTGAEPIKVPLSPDAVSDMVGGGGTQTTDIGGLDVLAPKSIRAAKAKSLLLALTPDTAGKAQVALLKGPKIVAQKGATFGAAGTYSLKLKLPRKLKAGNHVIRVSFTPAGATKAVTKTLKVKVIAAKKKPSKKKAAVNPDELEGHAIARKPVKPVRRKPAVKILR